jgi:hypothetical protein
MGDVYVLVKRAKTEFPQASLVLSGVIRRRDVSWRRIGALNDRNDWVARTLGATFLEPNSWIEDWDFGRDGLDINRSGEINVGGGTPERTMNMSTKDQVQTGAVIRRQEDTSDDYVATGGAQMIEGNSLVLMQVNCRSILNKSLEFWNLIDTYNPDVMKGTES